MPFNGKKKTLTARQQRLVDVLPLHNWVIGTAGLEAGYSKQYCDKQLPTVVGKSRAMQTAIAKKKAQISKKTGVTPEKITNEWLEILDKEGESAQNKALALVNLGKHIGYYEKDNEQQQNQSIIALYDQIITRKALTAPVIDVKALPSQPTPDTIIDANTASDRA